MAEKSYTELIAEISVGKHGDVCCLGDTPSLDLFLGWVSQFGLDAALELAAYSCACPTPAAGGNAPANPP